MNTRSRGFVCRLLAALMIAAPYAAQTQAAMIGSQQAIARFVDGGAQAERDTVSRFMTRSDVQRQLGALGAPNAAERVAALTDDEVRQLAGKIDALPAGADSGVTLLLIVALVLLLLLVLDWRK